MAKAAPDSLKASVLDHVQTAAVTEARHPTPQQRLEAGKARRSDVSRADHAGWKASKKRADPIAILEESSRPRLQHLVPIRYGRMLVSPFTYLRGSPAVMASDLATTPVSGIPVQACGDAHLMNFGLYASPERNLLFDLNDFDETLPGPWEWDVKRLATSCVVAGRSYGLRKQESSDAARASVRSYREHMRRFSEMRLLDVWYSRVDAEEALKIINRDGQKGMARDLSKARRRNSLQALSKLALPVNGTLRLLEDPPLVSHIQDPKLAETMVRFMHSYLATLQDDRRTLIERYRFVDFALKVVGVGSVGTRCYIILLDSSHAEDPLLLQVKEARPSVLEPHLERSKQHNAGHRVVSGQRLMQSASDIFLGWSSEAGHDFYVRQLRDMKGTAELEGMSAATLADYAALCGWVLARAHARSGDAAMLSGYLGKSDAIDDAIVRFANAFADQNDRDFETFQAAVKSGRLPAERGI
jgi:uncharacterized protein (DUF2252 family)